MITDLYLGDALTILAQLPGSSIDLCMTSPPYADQRKHTYGGISPDQYVAWFLPIATQLHRVLKPTASFILNIKEKVVKGERHPYVLELILALRNQGWRWVEEYIWCKTTASPGYWPNRFRDSWERLLHFTKEPHFFINQKAVQVPIGAWAKTRLTKLSANDQQRTTSATGSGFGRQVSNWQTRPMVNPSNVLHLAPETRNRQHSAVYPTELPEFFIKLLSPAGGLVLDPFAGSGTTLLTAWQLGCSYIGIDLQADAIDVAQTRLQLAGVPVKLKTLSSSILVYNQLDFRKDQMPKRELQIYHGRVVRQRSRHRLTARILRHSRLRRITHLPLSGWLLGFLLTSTFFYLSLGFFGWWALGSFSKLNAELPIVDLQAGIKFESNRIYASDGSLLYEDNSQGKRIYVSLDQIAPTLISATIATEDASFYQNQGIDVVALLRALSINFSGKGSSGGSTISQQLARLLYLPDQRYEQSLQRKLKEAILAWQLNTTYSKDQVLTSYLNQIYYGRGAYGCEAAALRYFGRHALELSTVEAAYLAGLPQAPSYYADHPDQAKLRQKGVLIRMQAVGYINNADQLASRPLAFIPLPSPIGPEPQFVGYVNDYLRGHYDAALLARGGLVITTTLIPGLQASARQIVQSKVALLQNHLVSNGAAVILEPGSGAILAMVGSVKGNDLNVSRARRAPGSSFKPFVYGLALEKGWQPTTYLLDEPTTFNYRSSTEAYAPKNYDSKGHGWVTLRSALANSYNIPAVKAMQFVGTEDTVALARILGFTLDDSFYGLSTVLGTAPVSLLQLTTAYDSFANQGWLVAANPISSVTYHGQELTAELVDQNHQVFSANTAFLITDILADNLARSPMFGLHSALQLPFPAAVKTGTTENNQDSWTVGYSKGVVVGSWLGNNGGQLMDAVTGATGAALVWHDLISLTADYKFSTAPFNPPATLQQNLSCKIGGGFLQDYFSQPGPNPQCLIYLDPPQNQLKAIPPIPYLITPMPVLTPTRVSPTPLKQPAVANPPPTPTPLTLQLLSPINPAPFILTPLRPGG